LNCAHAKDHLLTRCHVLWSHAAQGSRPWGLRTVATLDFMYISLNEGAHSCLWCPVEMHRSANRVCLLAPESLPSCNSHLSHITKLPYTWHGDYYECEQPAQLPFLTWGLSSFPPGTTCVIRSLWQIHACLSLKK